MKRRILLEDLNKRDIIEVTPNFVKYLKSKIKNANIKNLADGIGISKIPLLRILALKKSYTAGTINKLALFFKFDRIFIEKNIVRWSPFGSRTWYRNSVALGFPLNVFGRVTKRKTSSLLISLPSFLVRNIIKPGDLVLVQIENICMPVKIYKDFEFTVSQRSELSKSLLKKLGKTVWVNLVKKFKPTTGKLKIKGSKIDLSKWFPATTTRYNSQWYYTEFKNIVYLSFLDSQKRIHHATMPIKISFLDFWKTAVYFSEGTIKWAFPEWETIPKERVACLDLSNTNPLILVNWVTYLEKMFHNLPANQLRECNLDYSSPKFNRKIEKALKSFWQKYGFRVKKIKYHHSDSKYFSPVGCLRISINHTGIAEAYMSLFKSLIQYVQESASTNKEIKNAIITFLIEESNGDFGCIVDFSRKNPYILINRYSKNENQIKVIQNFCSKIGIKSRTKKDPYPHLIIDEIDSVIKLARFGVFDKKKERRLKLIRALLCKFSTTKTQKKYSRFIFDLEKELEKISGELMEFYSNLNLPLSVSVKKFLNGDAKFIAGKL